MKYSPCITNGGKFNPMNNYNNPANELLLQEYEYKYPNEMRSRLYFFMEKANISCYRLGKEIGAHHACIVRARQAKIGKKGAPYTPNLVFARRISKVLSQRIGNGIKLDVKHIFPHATFNNNGYLQRAPRTWKTWRKKPRKMTIEMTILRASQC